MCKKSKLVLLFIIDCLLLTSCSQLSEQILLADSLQGNEKYEIEILDTHQIKIGAPAGICIYDDNIYICDSENHCIAKFSSDMKLINTYGVLGMEEGNFSQPIDITFSGKFFYVLDSGNKRVQKFSSDFEFIKAYNLNSLLSEQGIGKYLSIAADKEENIYVSVFSPDIDDAHIYIMENNEWKETGKNVIGYVCEGNEGIYFANMLEFHVEKRKYSAESGSNILYQIKNNKLKKIVRLEDKYVPTALTYWNDKIYMISAGVSYIQCFTLSDEKFISILPLPQVSLFMYMAIDESGNIYISDNENKIFYRAVKEGVK